MPEMKPSRDGYGEGLVWLGEHNPNVVVLGADLTSSTRADWFQEKFPERFYSIGIAEQNMLCVAAGLSLSGKIPFVCTYGVFVAGRAWDQVRTTICYANLNVKIGGAHGGISVGPDGATHQALEDIALMRVLPNMTVVVPCDSIETRKATIAIGQQVEGPGYVRFGREPIPIVTEESTPFTVGKAATFRPGNDVSVIACGYLVGEAMNAAEQLEQEGISTRVINLHTVKPIDREAIVKAAQETGAIVAAEEHQVMAGFCGAVAEVVVNECPVPMRFVGIQDRFGESGEPEELLCEFNCTANDIVAGVKQVLEMKGK